MAQEGREGTDTKEKKRPKSSTERKTFPETRVEGEEGRALTSIFLQALEGSCLRRFDRASAPAAGAVAALGTPIPDGEMGRAGEEGTVESDHALDRVDGPDTAWSEGAWHPVGVEGEGRGGGWGQMGAVEKLEDGVGKERGMDVHLRLVELFMRGR